MKFIKLLTASLVALSLHAADKDHTIVVGVSPVPHAEILEFVKPKLKDKGYDLVISEISDYTLSQMSLQKMAAWTQISFSICHILRSKTRLEACIL